MFFLCRKVCVPAQYSNPLLLFLTPPPTTYLATLGMPGQGSEPQEHGIVGGMGGRFFASLRMTECFRV